MTMTTIDLRLNLQEMLVVDIHLLYKGHFHDYCLLLLHLAVLLMKIDDNVSRHVD